MRLNHDLVRYVLLSIELSDSPSGPTEEELLNSLKSYGEFDWDQVSYTIQKLQEAKFISGNVRWGNNKPVLIKPGNLTYDGHKFLDNIRDDSVWKETKRVVSKFSSVSLSLIANVAAGVITQLIQKQLGI